MTLEQGVLGVIREVMPADADISRADGLGDMKFVVSWKLNDDPERPNKPSKTIAVIVSREAAEDFESVTGPKKEEAYRRLKAFFSQKLSSFDPSHSTPKFEPPPVEKWLVNTHVLFG